MNMGKYLKQFLILVLLSLSLTNTYGQTDSSYQDYYRTYDYEYQYTKDLYQYEKNKLVWSIVGSGLMVVGNGVNYYRYGQSGYAYFGGLSLGFNLYSVGKLVYLNRKLKRMEDGKSYN